MATVAEGSNAHALAEAVREIADTLRRGSGGKTDPFHVGMDAADHIDAALGDFYRTEARDA